MADSKVYTNQEIADMLARIAELLEVQNANPHRVRAYRNGAARIRNLDQSVAEIVRNEDGQTLQELPDIGVGLSRVITNFVHKGRSDVLDRLRGQVSPEELFSNLPGIGETLSARIVEQLEINTLEELERAAHDGRLSEVEGFGAKRVQTVRNSLAGLLSRSAQRRAQQRTSDKAQREAPRPDVGVLLDVDAEYRRKAKSGELHQIAPRRFNPENKAWLPILHTSREAWDFTVLFSNTARAHKFGKTHDWVVIYYERNAWEDQATVLTAQRGPQEGKRIVRGREVECERYYERRKLQSGGG